MEPEQFKMREEIDTSPKKSVLFKVTPLSKYLAMLLFILLPFIGGYVGYMLAPEKVVEVERVVLQEVEKEFYINEESVVDFLNQKGIYILHRAPRVTYMTMNEKVFALWNFWANVGSSERLEILLDVTYSSPEVETGVSVIDTPKVPLLVHDSDVYYRANLLEGLNAQDMNIREDGLVLYDDDTVYVVDNNCRDLFIRRGSAEDINSFQPSC